LLACLLARLSVFVVCARWIESFQVGRPKVWNFVCICCCCNLALLLV
jgi:hypothetical protein